MTLNPKIVPAGVGKVRMTWTPDPAAFGYRFYVNDHPVSKSVKPGQASTTFAHDGQPTAYGIAAAYEKPAETVVFPPPPTPPLPNINTPTSQFLITPNHEIQPRDGNTNYNRRVLCDDHREQQARTTTARKLKQFQADRAMRKPACDECGSDKAVVRCYRLDPRNWRERLSLRCPKCRSGWEPITYQRVAVEGTFLGGRARSGT